MIPRQKRRLRPDRRWINGGWRKAPDMDRGIMKAGSRAGRLSMYGADRLKLGMFGPNCSGGRSLTKVRWSRQLGRLLETYLTDNAVLGDLDVRIVRQ